MKTDTTPKTREPASSESPSTLCSADFASKIAAKLHSGEWYSEEQTAQIIREIVMAESKRTSIVVMILDHDAQDNSYRWNQYAGPFKSADDAKEWARLNRGEVMTKLILPNVIGEARADNATPNPNQTL